MYKMWSKAGKNKDKSNENWAVYNCKEKCKCGGEYGLYVDGRLIGGEDGG